MNTNGFLKIGDALQTIQTKNTINNVKDDIFSGFYFKRRRNSVNWRQIAGVNIEQIIRQVDISTLQEVLETIAFSDIESEDLRRVDPNFIKLFQLSQLIIEFLLHSQV
jgi:hypothetical protein